MLLLRLELPLRPLRRRSLLESADVVRARRLGGARDRSDDESEPELESEESESEELDSDVDISSSSCVKSSRLFRLCEWKDRLWAHQWPSPFPFLR